LEEKITSLGASLAGRKFKHAFKASLNLLARHQSELGQVPNCVGSYNEERQSDVTFNTIDSTLWFIIGHYVYALAYDDHDLLEKHKSNIAKGIVWLRYQDPNEDKCLAQQPTMDWQDAFPHKYGRTINTHALYYAALHLVGRHELAEFVKNTMNGQEQAYLSLYSQELGYYLPWAWKDHDGIREQEEWFDSLGNMLAIVTGLADETITENILAYVKKAKVNKPYPVKAIWPPIKKGDPAWRDYFEKCDARSPYNYLNGGVWPFVGGFYVAALVKAGRQKEAEQELVNLAKANLARLDGHEFNEWLHGRTGKPKGEPYQGWSAGTYIYAYECVKQNKVLFFG